MKIENAGDRIANHVKLKTPQAKLLLIKREGKSPEVKPVNEIVELENVQPKEIISVIAWTNISPSVYTGREFRLTHSSGIGAIKIFEPVSPSPFWKWMERWWFFVVFVVMVLGWLMLIILAESNKRKTTSNRAVEGDLQEAAGNVEEET